MCEINRYVALIKTKVMVNTWAIMSDPEYWQNTDNFILEILNSNTTLDFIGTNFTYMPFRAGKRMLMMS